MPEYIREFKEQPSDPIGGASGEKRFFTVQYLGKLNNPEFPFTVANEVVATQIGIALGLNLPTVITHTTAGETLALIQMIDRDPAMQAPPPVTSQKLRDYVAESPDEIHAAIVFDLYVANNDRAFGPERRNLAIDTHGRLQLYDHGNACFYRHRPTVGVTAGVARLDAVERDLTELFDMDHKGNHYWEFLTDWDLVRKWCDRIRQLPDFMLEAAVGRIPRALSHPEESERRRLTSFLLDRQSYLFEHIEKWKSHFPGLPERGAK